jgi:hypothetical protein
MKRNRTEAGLENMLKDEAADGTPLDPHRDYEPEYQRLSALVDRTNRSMLRIYAEYLGANAAYILERDPVPSRRKRAADDANMARPNRPPSMRQELAESSAPAAAGGATDTTTPCPYSHAKDQPAPPPLPLIWRQLFCPKPAIRLYSYTSHYGPHLRASPQLQTRGRRISCYGRLLASSCPRCSTAGATNLLQP